MSAVSSTSAYRTMFVVLMKCTHKIEMNKRVAMNEWIYYFTDVILHVIMEQNTLWKSLIISIKIKSNKIRLNRRKPNWIRRIDLQQMWFYAGIYDTSTEIAHRVSYSESTRSEPYDESLKLPLFSYGIAHLVLVTHCQIRMTNSNSNSNSTDCIFTHT